MSNKSRFFRVLILGAFLSLLFAIFYAIFMILGLPWGCLWLPKGHPGKVNKGTGNGFASRGGPGGEKDLIWDRFWRYFEVVFRAFVLIIPPYVLKILLGRTMTNMIRTP